MLRRIGVSVLCSLLWLLTIPVSEGQSMPTVIVDESLSSYIDIIPVDSAHIAQLPATIAAVVGTLPAGSVIVKNKTSKAVTTLVTIWTYIDKSGNRHQHKFACDGYHLAPVQTIIGALESALVSPSQCTSEPLFPKLKDGSLLSGGFTYPDEQSDPATTADTIGVTVDAVIYNNGEIAGRDTIRYYRDIQERFAEIAALLASVDAAQTAGSTLSDAVENIRISNQDKSDPILKAQWNWARRLQSSPNMEGTVAYLRKFAAPPPFYHAGVVDP